MSLQRKINNKQLLDALDHIDDRFVAELVTSIKPPEAVTGEPMQKKNILRSVKYAALLAACAVLMGAAIPLASHIIGQATLGTQGNNPGENVEQESNIHLETEPAETEQIDYPTNLVIESVWSPKEISDGEAYDIVSAYLASDPDPNKFAYTYSVRCYGKFGFNTPTPVYVVMIDSDRWTWEEGERVEKFREEPYYWGFIFQTDQPMLVYKDGVFYTLKEAYDQSVLEKLDVEYIRWPHREQNSADSFVYPVWLAGEDLHVLSQSNPEHGTGRFAYECYGKFDGVYAIIPKKNMEYFEPKVTVESIGSYSFVYPNENKIQICANGTYYSLTDAYAQKIISNADLAEIYKNYNMHIEIRTVFLEKFGHEIPDGADGEDDIIVMLQGVYGDVYAAVVASVRWNNTKSPTETVNGLTFTWEQQYDIHVYTKGEFYTLTEAFEQGLLTADQLKEVHEHYHTSFGEMYRR